MSTFKIDGTTFHVDRNSAKNVRTGKKVAIKRISPMGANEVVAKQALREVRLLRHLGQHSNVVTLVDLSVRPRDDELYVIMELMDTDLHRIIQSQQALTDAHHKHFMYQLIRGVQFAHRHGVIHRDLKPSNLLVTKNCDLRITDFGLSRMAPEENVLMTEHVVTRWYRPPELMLCADGNYTAAVDTWSVGCIFAELLGRKPLFPGKNFMHQLRLIFDVIGTPRKEELAFIKSEQAMTFMRNLNVIKKTPFKKVFPYANPKAVDLLERMLVFTPSERISVDDALKHPYFASVAPQYTDPDPELDDRFEFEFEKMRLSTGDLKRLIVKEVQSFKAEAAARAAGADRATAAAAAAAATAASDERKSGGGDSASGAGTARSGRSTARGRAARGDGAGGRSSSRGRDRRDSNGSRDGDASARYGSSDRRGRGRPEHRPLRRQGSDRSTGGSSTARSRRGSTNTSLYDQHGRRISRSRSRSRRRGSSRSSSRDPPARHDTDATARNVAHTAREPRAVASAAAAADAAQPRRSASARGVRRDGPMAAPSRANGHGGIRGGADAASHTARAAPSSAAVAPEERDTQPDARSDARRRKPSTAWSEAAAAEAAGDARTAAAAAAAASAADASAASVPARSAAAGTVGTAGARRATGRQAADAASPASSQSSALSPEDVQHAPVAPAGSRAPPPPGTGIGSHSAAQPSPSHPAAALPGELPRSPAAATDAHASSAAARQATPPAPPPASPPRTRVAASGTPSSSRSTPRSSRRAGGGVPPSPASGSRRSARVPLSPATGRRGYRQPLMSPGTPNRSSRVNTTPDSPLPLSPVNTDSQRDQPPPSPAVKVAAARASAAFAPQPRRAQPATSSASRRRAPASSAANAAALRAREAAAAAAAAAAQANGAMPSAAIAHARSRRGLGPQQHASAMSPNEALRQRVREASAAANAALAKPESEYQFRHNTTVPKPFNFATAQRSRSARSLIEGSDAKYDRRAVSARGSSRRASATAALAAAAAAAPPAGSIPASNAAVASASLAHSGAAVGGSAPVATGMRRASSSNWQPTAPQPFHFATRTRSRERGSRHQPVVAHRGAATASAGAGATVPGALVGTAAGVPGVRRTASSGSMGVGDDGMPRTARRKRATVPRSPNFSKMSWERRSARPSASRVSAAAAVAAGERVVYRGSQAPAGAAARHRSRSAARTRNTRVY